jgi:hypothetical protein
MSENGPSAAVPGTDVLAGYLTPSLLELLGDAVTVISPDWRYLYVSTGAAAIIGKPATEVMGLDVWDVFPEVVGTPQYDAMLRAMSTRERERVVWFFDTVNGWFEQHALPVADGLVVLVNDITEQRLSEWRAEQLVVLGEALAESTTPAEVNGVVCRHAFALVGATGGGLVLADEQQQVMRAAGWSGAAEALAAQWTEYPLATSTPGTHAYSTGDAVYLSSLSEARGRFPEIAQALVSAGRHTVAALPLVCGGVRLGALVVTFESERALGVGDRQFLTTTAAMAAQAVLRARLLAAEQESVAALQRSLLPTTLPQPVGAQLVARYTAADSTTEVGGDWFDVVRLADGGTGLVLGDVEGHDLRAAALMGLIRSAVRAAALDGRGPAQVLADANRLLASLELERIVTLVYVPPLVIDGLGHVGEMPLVVGPPLGVWDAGQHWDETASDLGDGAAFVLFSDGLVEVRGEDLSTGLDRLRTALAAHAGEGADELADAALASRSPVSRDDVALLCLRLTPTG